MAGALHDVEARRFGGSCGDWVLDRLQLCLRRPLARDDARAAQIAGVDDP